jgi:hypothetical protein
MGPWLASALRLAALLLYLASLFLVPFQTNHPGAAWWGIGILLLGWMTVLGGPVAWLANPLALYALVRMRKYPRKCTLFCLFAVLVAPDSYRAIGMSFGFDSKRDIVAGTIHALGAGAYVWFASLVVMLAAAALHLRLQARGEAGAPLSPRTLCGGGRRCAAFTVIALAAAVTAYGCHAWWANHENERLAGIVRAELEGIAVPAGSQFVYEEAEASRACRTATVTRLFASDLEPAHVCDALSRVLTAQGWESYYGCRQLTYQQRPGTRPSYSFSRLDARVLPGTFGIFLTARPKDAWGNLFMLSGFGESEAVPLTRQLGRSFFTIRVFYTEDRPLRERLCPQDGTRCDCIQKSLWEWRFASGRRFSRSE